MGTRIEPGHTALKVQCAISFKNYLIALNPPQQAITVRHSRMVRHWAVCKQTPTENKNSQKEQLKTKQAQKDQLKTGNSGYLNMNQYNLVWTNCESAVILFAFQNYSCFFSTGQKITVASQCTGSGVYANEASLKIFDLHLCVVSVRKCRLRLRGQRNTSTLRNTYRLWPEKDGDN